MIYIISTDSNITVAMKTLCFLLTKKPFSLSQKRDIAELDVDFCRPIS